MIFPDKFYNRRGVGKSQEIIPFSFASTIRALTPEPKFEEPPDRRGENGEQSKGDN
jgi:hypothetical protein